MKKMTFCFVVVSFLFQACGTVIHGTKQDLAIKTVPSGITARIGATECVTPCVLSDVSRNTKELYLKKGENRERMYYISYEKSVNVWSVFLGNIIWLEIGIPIDFLSGGAYTIQDIYARYDDLPE